MDAALTFLASLRAHHLLSTVAVNMVIAAAGRCCSWTLAVALLQDMESRSLCLTVVTLNSLLSSLHRGSVWRQACRAFSGLCDHRVTVVTPDQITYNVLIKACSLQRWEAAQDLASSMRAGAVQPDKYTYSSLLSEKSWQVAQAALETRSVNSVNGVNSVNSMDSVDAACFRASIGRGCWERSLAVVSRMRALGLLGLRTDGGSQALNALYACLGKWRWVLQGLDKTGTSDLLRLNSAMDTCIKSRQWRVAVNVFSLLHISGLRSDIVGQNCLIQAIRHQWQCALECLAGMLRCRISPDEPSYIAVFGACARSPNARETIRLLLSHMSLHSLEQSVVTCGAAISACEPEGAWPLALWVLSKAALNDVCYGAAISVCEKARRWKFATQLLHGARSNKLRLDAVSISAAMSACETSQTWRAPLALLSCMAEGHILPNQISYSSAASAAASKAQRWQTTLELMDAAGTGGKLDVTSCSLVIGICESHGLVRRIPDLLAGIESVLTALEDGMP